MNDTQKILRVQHRRAILENRFNAANCQNYLQMYAPDATLHDPDIHRITGTQDLGEYFEMLFKFAIEHGCPPLQLKSNRMLVKGKFVYDIGEYCWSTLRCGRYFHKWAFIEDDFYLISDSFTVEEMLMIDENMNIP